jgi:hypothetical protein
MWNVDLGNRLQRWWNRVRGYEPPTARPVKIPEGKQSVPTAARPLDPVAGTDSGETLKLSVEGEPTQDGRKPRPGEEGFDPYANSAGYNKPRGWDAVTRK